MATAIVVPPTSASRTSGCGVTDSDGDVTDSNGVQASETITIAVNDDGPTVVIDNTDPASAVEAQTIVGDWSLTPGADGVTGANFTISVNGGPAAPVSFESPINTGNGVLTINALGTWTFVAADNLDNDVTQSVSFTLTAKDGDGDTSSDSQTITISDGTDPSVLQNATIGVDEEGLGTANATGSASASTVESNTGTVQFHAGSDNITAVAFGAVAGITGDVDGVAGTDITWTRVDDTRITGTIGGITAITLTLTPPSLPITAGSNGSASVAVVLSDNFPHPDANGQNVINLTGITVVATDTDSDTATATVQVNLTDDEPTLTISDTPASAAEGQAISGTFALTPGADGVTGANFTIWAPASPIRRCRMAPASIPARAR